MLAEALCTDYEVDPDTARRDVEQFLFRLRDMRLVSAASAEAAK